VRPPPGGSASARFDAALAGVAELFAAEGVRGQIFVVGGAATALAY
jgi:hypothetical protein